MSNQTFFEWDKNKNLKNQLKHGVSFSEARLAFEDKKRVINKDMAHSALEQRWFCLGKVNGAVLTVRFTIRFRNIRIIGAGYWRKGKKEYEKENNIH